MVGKVLDLVLRLELGVIRLWFGQQRHRPSKGRRHTSSGMQ